MSQDLKLEAVVIPVSDVDRAKKFYGSLGWRLDADFAFDNGFRVVQFTPPGSGCSVQFGANISFAAPGSARGLYLIVTDIEAARHELGARGVAVSEVFHAGSPGAQFQADGLRKANYKVPLRHSVVGSVAKRRLRGQFEAPAQTCLALPVDPFLRDLKYRNEAYPRHCGLAQLAAIEPAEHHSGQSQLETIP